MLILISPAKTLDFVSRAPSALHTEPAFLERSTLLIERLRKFTPRKLEQLMQISPQLAHLNVERFRAWQGNSDASRAKQAPFAFDGDVYEGLDGTSLETAQLAFAQQHLRILSGLYGVLKPLDRIEPYRLEMGTKLTVARSKNLYGFWGSLVTDALNAELGARPEPVVVNLASEEYFKVVKTARLKAEVITPVFEERKDGRYKVISFFAKRARGLMTRYAIARGISHARGLQDFSLEGYRFAPEASNAEVWRFRRAGGQAA
jgi:cytoplasmic iron level regulating protein YaaA (DUF328/UPF0246 family)